MSEFIRTKTRIAGGVTPEEMEKLREHTKKWTAIALRTDPIEPEKIIPAIKGLYNAADLAEPAVATVPSPLAMSLALGVAAAVWHQRNEGKYEPPASLPSDGPPHIQAIRTAVAAVI